MILKLDHITYTCRRRDVKAVLEDKFPHYQLEFKDTVSNLAIKEPLLRNCSPTHDLYYLTSVDNIPIEITAYDEIFPRPPFYRLENRTIVQECPDKQAALLFYQSFLGLAEPIYGKLSMQNILDKEKYHVDIKQNDIETITGGHRRLDVAGFVSLAFLVNHMDDLRTALLQKGYECTEIAALTVNNRALNIFFVLGPNSEIVEFIEMRR